MGKYLIAYVMLMLLLIFLSNFERKPKTKWRDIRLNQINNMVQQTAILIALDKKLQEKIKPSKRMGVEKTLERAGLPMSFFEFFILSAMSGILSALIFGTALSNLLLAVVFLVIGSLFPYQIVGYIKNKRLTLMENQVGSFLKMTISRYKNTHDFNKVLRLVEKEFRGEEPIHSEIAKTIRDIDVNVPVTEALSRMADRMDNKYMKLFASYYEITTEVGTGEAKDELLAQALSQHEESLKLKRELKNEISGPKQEAYIMVGAVPAFAVYQIFTSDNYIAFMTGTTMGRIGTTAIIAVLLFSVWIINNKIGAPLD